ncbi:hypothetical protein [Nitrosomonas marina]|nr:hypothetical protein [Nitrosomonas marina]
MLNYRTFFAGSFVLLTGLFLKPFNQAVASSYLGQVCLVMTVNAVLDGQPVEIKEGVLRMGVDNMRDNHITVLGTLETSADALPVGGNAELINNIWRMNLLSTWHLGNDTYHVNLIPETLEGDFSRISQVYNPELQTFEPSYLTGNIVGFACPVVHSGSACDFPENPPGHLPPPGECRIWNPELPPGQQSPPSACGAFFNNVPPGLCLVDHYGVVREIGGGF